MAHVRLFAAAAESCGARELDVEAASLGELLAALGGRGADATRVLAQCAVLVDGVRRDAPETPIAPGSLVDVLPPFAGG